MKYWCHYSNPLDWLVHGLLGAMPPASTVDRSASPLPTTRNIGTYLKNKNIRLIPERLYSELRISRSLGNFIDLGRSAATLVVKRSCNRDLRKQLLIIASKLLHILASHQTTFPSHYGLLKAIENYF